MLSDKITMGLSVLILFGVVIGVYELKVRKLNDTIALQDISIASKDVDIANLKLTVADCKHTIEASNKAISEMEADYTTKVDELEKWKKKPPSVRYEVIYEKYPSAEVKSNECNATFTILDEIRKAGL